jgi:hypothetical protein
MKYVLHKVNPLGMGNRLLSLTTAIAICRSTGAKLIVDWKNSGVVQPDFWDLFRLAGCEDVLAEVQDASAVNGLSSAQTGWECRYDQCIDGVYSKVNRNGDYAFLDIQEIPPISGLRTFFKGEKQGDVLVLAGYTAQGLEPTLLLRHLRFAPRVFERLRTDLEALIGDKHPRDLVGLHVRAAHSSMSRPNYADIAKCVNSVPGRVLVVATDLESEERKFKELLGDKVLCSRKSYPKSEAAAVVPSLEPLALHRIAFDPKTLTSPDGVSSMDIAYQALLDWCAVASCSRIFYQPGSTFSHIILYFSRAKPWKVAPHCQATPKQWSAGFHRTALKWAARPGLIPGLSGAEAGS